MDSSIMKLKDSPSDKLIVKQVPADQGNGFVKLENVERIYKMGDQEIRALKNITLNLASGQLIVVLGPSGSGKTTLLNDFYSNQQLVVAVLPFYY